MAWGPLSNELLFIIIAQGAADFDLSKLKVQNSGVIPVFLELGKILELGESDLLYEM